MKTRIFLAAIMAIGIMSFTFGQERSTEEMRTLFGNKDNKISHGGYGAISVGYTQIDNKDVMTLGGRAGWLIDHHITLGFAGKGFISQVFIDSIPGTPENGLYMSGGYGGLFVEPIIFPNSPIHVSFPVLIGGGGFVLNEHDWHYYNYDYKYEEPVDWDSYFVLEPGVEIELNLVKFLRVAFGGSYRYTSNLHISEVPDDLLNGFNGTVTLKFGWF